MIECLPSLQHDPNRPEDVLKVDCDEDGIGGNYAADCLRYLVATGQQICLPLFEIASVLVCLDHVASVIINADHSII